MAPAEPTKKTESEMKMKSLLAAMPLSMALLLPAHADETALSSSTATLIAGSTDTLVVATTVPMQPYTALQFCVRLPEGFRFASAEVDVCIADTDSLSAAGRRCLTDIDEEGVLTCLVYSSSDAPFPADAPLTAFLAIAADSLMAAGSYDMTLEQAVFASVPSAEGLSAGWYPADVRVPIAIEEPIEDGIATADAPAKVPARYSLSGQRVMEGQRGIVLSKGRKEWIR